MQEEESIQEMYTRFTTVTNELYSLGEVISPHKKFRKILNIFPKICKSKVHVIFETRGLNKMTMDELVSNLKTYEL